VSTSYGFSTDIPLGKIRSFAQERAVAALEQVLGDGINDASMEELTDEDGHPWLSVRCPEQGMSHADIQRIDGALEKLAAWAAEGFAVDCFYEAIRETDFHGPTEAAAAKARTVWCLEQAVGFLKRSGVNLEALEQALDLVQGLARLDISGEYPDQEDSHARLVRLIQEARMICESAKQSAEPKPAPVV
jgi:hypothetical protein